MLNTAIIPWPHRIERVTPARLSIPLSRLLLLLAAAELVTMPLTQTLWRWDGFFHGGQDFELGFFLTVSCLCLVLLSAQRGCQGLRQLMAVCGLYLGSVVRRAARILLPGPALVPEMLYPGAGGVFLRRCLLRI